MALVRGGNYFTVYITSLLCIAMLSLINKAEGADKKSWSVSPLLGVNRPELRLLNDGEFKAKLPTRGSLVLEPEGTTFDFSFIVENPLPAIEFGTESGIEFTIPFSDRDALVMGVGTWEGGSTSSIVTTVAFQGVLNKVGYERSAKVSYTQYFFGWRRDLINRTGKYKIYSRLLLHEIFDLDHQEGLVLDFNLPTGETFKRVFDIKSQATGIMMFQFGVGGEYFLLDWLSMGADVGYSFSPRSFKLNSYSLKSDKQTSDDFDLTLPVAPDVSTGNLRYLDQNNQYQPLSLRLDGWRVLFRLNIYY